MNRYNLLFVILLSQNFLATAQKTNQRCFFYDYTARVSTISDAQSKMWEDKMVLAVQDNYTIFESYSFYQRNLVMQERKEKGMSSEEFGASLSSLPSARFKFAIQRNYPQQESVFYDEIVKSHYRYQEPLTTPEWTIHPETKQVNDLRCQRATTEMFGRKFEAWFAEEIPLREGPYKFFGLPGLIVEVYDQEKAHHFVLTGSESPCDYPEVERSHNYLDVTRQEYLQARSKFYQSVTTAYREEGMTLNAGDEEFQKMVDKDMQQVNNLIEME